MILEAILAGLIAIALVAMYIYLGIVLTIIVVAFITAIAITTGKVFVKVFKFFFD